ncbi:autotransporter secretion outer membrane protein TamA [Amphiplicatus metriothermophilus]|uniref:Autotransporter secretion outer membrane protein TamA n=1 Tax=Amphiplicatus metriothermophilus TaxID=1519374 RepID=A0A239PV92_9PROT|nr:autotransporter secretion outer membrane protein TamA [Amphiplicatus metriothermophilus]
MTAILRRAMAGAAATAMMMAAAAAAPYETVFEGAPNGLADKLRMVSALAAGKRAYPTATALRRAAREDLKAIENALEAAGYYAGSARFEVVDGAKGVRRVVFTIEPGPKFRIEAYRIVYEDAGEAERPADLAALGLKGDGAGDGASLKALQERFLSGLWDRGFPAARIVSRHVEADMAAGTGVAVFRFESGPRARFGAIELSGADETAPVYVEKLRTWTPGEPFDRSKLIAFRDRLAKTGLFNSIDVAPGAPDESGAAPILVTVVERKRRTIGVGASYSTSEGPGGRLFFEYRNAFHRGERAFIELKGAEIEQSLKADLAKPLPDFPGAAFFGFAFTNETTDAFNARTAQIESGLVKRWLDDRLETRGGVALETSGVRSASDDQRTYFFSMPLSATWNTENDLLNPTRGARASLSVTPYTGSDHFTRAEIAVRSRVAFGPDDRLTAAARARLGATLGSSLAGLPANKRYYAGGGASVRGYDFQAVGPLDAEGDPVGGRSVIEGAFEARARVLKNLQIAGFLDAGSVSSQAFPDFNEKFFLGAGGGVRYFTPVGPIRVDVAVPLDGRESDRAWQLYISLGQPF